MTLREARVSFTWNLCRLVAYARRMGYEVALDEVKRDPRIAALNAETGKGIRDSLHTLGLAADIAAYREGRYLTDSADYRVLGDWWVKQHPLARWGGNFTRADGCHFSFTWRGRQ